MAQGFQAGDLVRQYANLYRWPVRERSILVEGEHEQRYFSLADKLYTKTANMCLLDTKLAIFPTGIGEEGGSYGLQRFFHPLRTVMDRDTTPDGRKIFHAVALFDSDNKGRQGFNALSGQHLNYRKWRDIFLLQRSIPRVTRDPDQTARLVETTNQLWRDMDCEIEDLVSPDLVKAFIAENPSCTHRAPEEKNGAIHCHFPAPAKANLVRFVEENAVLQDVILLVDALKSLRYHLGLEPDGEPLRALPTERHP